MSSIGRLLLAKSLVLVSRATFGEEILLSTSDAPIDGTAWNQGWWSDTRANATTNESPFTGIKDGDHRAFFSFLLPSTLSNTSIVSATLLQSRGASSSDNELQETIGLFDVTTNEVTLNHNVGASSAIYSDLGSGTSFGQFVVPGGGAADAVIEMPLNAAGLSDLNAHVGSYFSIGAALLSNDGNDYLFASNIQGPAMLRLETVPEPANLTISAIVLVGVYCRSTRNCGRLR